MLLFSCVPGSTEANGAEDEAEDLVCWQPADFPAPLNYLKCRVFMLTSPCPTGHPRRVGKSEIRHKVLVIWGPWVQMGHQWCVVAFTMQGGLCQETANYVQSPGRHPELP